MFVCSQEEVKIWLLSHGRKQITDPALPADQENLPWELSAFAKSLTVNVVRLSERNIEFDLIGVDASIANALRRILMAEVCATNQVMLSLAHCGSNSSFFFFSVCASLEDSYYSCRACLRLDQHFFGSRRSFGSALRPSANRMRSQSAGVSSL